MYVRYVTIFKLNAYLSYRYIKQREVETKKWKDTQIKIEMRRKIRQIEIDKIDRKIETWKER